MLAYTGGSRLQMERFPVCRLPNQGHTHNIGKYARPVITQPDGLALADTGSTDNSADMDKEG